MLRRAALSVSLGGAHPPVSCRAHAGGVPSTRQGVSVSAFVHVQPHVLVVENDDVWRDLLTFQIGRLGASSTSVSSLSEAIEVFDRSPVDLVLAEYRLRGASGL